MDKELNELMQINVISENIDLSKMIEDIMPIQTTNKETIENTIPQQNKALNQEFRIVVYKKENPVISFLKQISFALKKVNIFGKARNIKFGKFTSK